MLSDCYPRDIDKNPRHIHVTQDVYPTGIPKTYVRIPKTYIPLGLQVYLLCDTYTSWVARVKWLLPKRYRQEPKTYTCHPRHIPKRYTQDISSVCIPRHIHVTQDIYPSGKIKVTCKGYAYMYPLGDSFLQRNSALVLPNKVGALLSWVVVRGGEHVVQCFVKKINVSLFTIFFALYLFWFDVVYLFIALLHFDLLVIVGCKHLHFIVIVSCCSFWLFCFRLSFILFVIPCCCRCPQLPPQLRTHHRSHPTPRSPHPQMVPQLRTHHRSNQTPRSPHPQHDPQLVPKRKFPDPRSLSLFVA